MAGGPTCRGQGVAAAWVFGVRDMQPSGYLTSAERKLQMPLVLLGQLFASCGVCCLKAVCDTLRKCAAASMRRLIVNTMRGEASPAPPGLPPDPKACENPNPQLSSSHPSEGV